MKEILTQSATRFESESSDMINKHNKRWLAKIGNVNIDIYTHTQYNNASPGITIYVC